MSADLLATSLPQRPAPGEDAAPRLHALGQPAPRRRPRLVYGLIAVGGALAIAGVQMGLSILTMQSTYEIQALTSQQRDLTFQKQIAEDELAGLSSPQYLAANAASLGMVTGQIPSYLRLSDAHIVGDDGGASGVSSIEALKKAAVSNSLIAHTPLVTDPDETLDGGVSAAASAASATQSGTEAGAATTDPTTPPAIADGLPTPATH